MIKINSDNTNNSVSSNISSNITNTSNNLLNLCNNCGKQGHLFHQCKLPITSYGLILFRSSQNGIEYLMLRRKDSFGYIDFIRGKYSPYNIEHLQNIINEMSVIEKERIISLNFDILWKQMWGETSNIQYKNEEVLSSKKFEIITNGILINGNMITLKDIVYNSNTQWHETEWEFPKGRRNYQEKDLECALREFEEETGISSKQINIIENLLPFEEIFIGTNHKSYKHKYFLAYTNMFNESKHENKDEYNLHNYQKTEVSKLEWKTIEGCLESIRPYNLEKKQLILNINKVLQEYRLY
jgi:8-oxo-dGTP pyrophosphatase MutT (NUDIX family)